jgi:capsular exopolysaccharide synthesis family protein
MSRVFEALQRANPELGSSMVRDGASSEALSEWVSTLSGESPVLEDGANFGISRLPEARLFAWTDPNSLAAENLRALSAKLRDAQQRRSLKKLLVTSAIRGDGKSTISSNLAITLAAHGEKTLLIDGDLHSPSLSETLGVRTKRGLATWHEDSEPIGNLIYRADTLPLWFLPGGECEEQPLKLIQSERTAALLKQLAMWFSWIVIDSPPLVPLADSSTWATMSDAVLLVARQGHTAKKAFVKGVGSLDRSKLFSIVMNDAHTNEERYYRSYYSSGVRNARNSKKGRV